MTSANSKTVKEEVMYYWVVYLRICTITTKTISAKESSKRTTKIKDYHQQEMEESKLQSLQSNTKEKLRMVNCASEEAQSSLTVVLEKRADSFIWKKVS